MDGVASFGEWVRRQRKALDMTQAYLARQVGCSAITIRKIEAGERRPSLQVAKLLAAALQLPAQEHALFLQVALGEQRVDRLTTPYAPAAIPTLSAAGAASNLPVPLTPLIGRQTELDALSAFLQRETVRLVTLTGPGGVGKTRLALQVATNLQTYFKDGVCFVVLAALREPTLILPTLAQMLNIRELPGERSLLEQITDTLRTRHLLLLLDNFEHLISAAPVITALLSACARLSVLVTSREALHLQGEQEYPVPPLTLLDAESSASPTTALQSEAVQLFVQRAQAVQPNFIVTAENVAAIVQICAHLDGLPLAIELAAARVKMLPPTVLLEQIVGVVGMRFDLLKCGGRDAPDRHQTLYQAIDWSYALLTPPEQVLLRRLGIFVGGWTLAAADAICAFGSPIVNGELHDQTGLKQNADSKTQVILDGLASLVDKSLVRQSELEHGEVRFSLLETIREFGLMRMEEQGEMTAIQRAHAHYYVAYAERAARTFGGQEEVLWFNRLATETGNFHAAFEWIIANQRTALGLRFGMALSYFWAYRRRIIEGRTKLAAILKMPSVSEYKRELAAVYIGAGQLAEGDSDYPQAFALLEVGLDQARSINDWRLMCDALNYLGQAKRAQGKYDQAHRYYEESLAIARDHGDQTLLAHCLKYMGIIVHLQGRLDAAFTLLHQGLVLARAAKEQMIVADILCELGCLARTRGDLKEAQRLLGEVIALAQQVDRSYAPGGCELNELGMIALGEKDYPAARRQIQQGLRLFASAYAYWGIALSFENLAIVAAAQEQPRRAYVLAGAATALRRVTQTASYSHTADQLRTALAALSSRFTQIDAGAAQVAGAQMTLEEAVAYACEEP